MKLNEINYFIVERWLFTNSLWLLFWQIWNVCTCTVTCEIYDSCLTLSLFTTQNSISNPTHENYKLVITKVCTFLGMPCKVWQYTCCKDKVIPKKLILQSTAYT